MDSSDVPTPGQQVPSVPPLIVLNATAIQFKGVSLPGGQHGTVLELSADNLVSATIMLTDEGVQQIIDTLTAGLAKSRLALPAQGLVGLDGNPL